MTKVRVLTLLIGAFLTLPVAWRLQGSPGPFSGWAQEKVLWSGRTAYQSIEAVEDPTTRKRYLFSDGRSFLQGVLDLDSPDRLALGYTRICMLGLAFLDRDAEAFLFLGLGPGSMPRYLRAFYPDSLMEAVEIDPEMVALGRRFFFLDLIPDLRIHIEDARAFTARSGERYDLIFLDAYLGQSTPGRLSTVEFFREIHRRLFPGGVLVANLLNSALDPGFVRILATISAAFPVVRIFQGVDPANQVVIALTSTRDPDLETLRSRVASILALNPMEEELKSTLDLETLRSWMVPKTVVPFHDKDIP